MQAVEKVAPTPFVKSATMVVTYPPWPEALTIMSVRAHAVKTEPHLLAMHGAGWSQTTKLGIIAAFLVILFDKERVSISFVAVSLRE